MGSTAVTESSGGNGIVAVSSVRWSIAKVELIFDTPNVKGVRFVSCCFLGEHVRLFGMLR
jgi:hypothetical protein